MIVRMWHGRVPAEKAAAYRKFLCGRAVPDYRSISGILDVNILERTDGEVVHFVTFTKWQDMDSIRRFAGPNPELAKYFPEDVDFLMEFEPNVVHYQIVG